MEPRHAWRPAQGWKAREAEAATASAMVSRVIVREERGGADIIVAPDRRPRATFSALIEDRLSTAHSPEAKTADPTARIASRICAIGYADLDQPVVAAVKRLIADGVAVAVAGTREEAP